MAFVVCVHNVGLSQIEAALLFHLADDRIEYDLAGRYPVPQSDGS